MFYDPGIISVIVTSQWKKLKCYYIDNYVLYKNNEASTNSYHISP